MLSIVRTTASDPEFQKLNARLDAELALRDGKDHSFYAQYNKTDHIRHVLVAMVDGKPAGCGAIKEYQPGIFEIKRMYVEPAHRGKGIATAVLDELERWAAELSAGRCILETGLKQPEAIALYRKNGYHLIPNYGPYEGVDNSVCFEKML